MAKWKDKAEFKSCVHDYADKMAIKVKSLALRPMTNKWASCSTDGNLNFNKELLDIEKELGEYVIVHELLHFNVPNHGKLWKSLMSAYLGDYEALEMRLKKITKGQDRESLVKKQSNIKTYKNLTTINLVVTTINLI